MQKTTWVVFAVVLGMLAGVGGLISCALLQHKGPQAEEWQPPRVVSLAGTKACFNYSLCTWVSGRAKGRPAAVLARDGDTLVLGLDEEGIILPYLASDGTLLSLDVDESGLWLGGKRVMFSAEADEWDWIGKASGEELADLRLFACKEPWGDGETVLPALRNLASANPNIGWLIEDAEVLRQVLPLFNPRWLILGGGVPMSGAETKLIAGEPNLEFMVINTEHVKSLEFLAALGRLRSLTLDGWDPQETGPVPPRCERLRSITVSMSDMKDLSPIAGLGGLDELHLVGCEDLADLRGLRGLSHLKALTLTGCEEISDLSVLRELKGLQWLGLPSGISQKELERVIAAQPDLRVLELVGCHEITDLAPLRRLDKLESLVLLGPKASLAPLHEMKNLRFLVLSEEAFEEAYDEVRKLEQALPDCLVVQGEPFCLGSGWILMLVPAVALPWVLSGRRGKKQAQRFPKNV